MSGNDFLRSYFCAANSGKGFVSFYDGLIARADRVFIIKGGPGTGKSRFLHEVADAAKKALHNVDYYYCSSDSSSLDAITIDRKTLFLDGTAPHSVDTTLPGARDSIIDLGAFFDVAALIGQRKRIVELNKKKALCFNRAYSYLSAAAGASDVADSVASSFVLHDKLTSAARRAMSALKCGDGFAVTKVALRSLGMNGETKLDTFERIAESYTPIVDFYGTAYLFLDELIHEAEKKKLKITVAVDPLDTDKADAVLLDDSGIAFGIGGNGDRKINMRRFADLPSCRLCRNEYRLADAFRKGLTDGSIASLKAAAVYHFTLEKIYGEAMDFAAKEEYTDNFISELLG